MRISDWSSDVCYSDLVHPGELALFRVELARHAMVQIPVIPMLCGGSPWVGGHYGDEFAEAHGKELVVRSRLATPLPSAGVGCALRSEEHTSELQSLMRISYAVFCLKKKKHN